MFFPKAGVGLGFDSTWDAGDRLIGRGWLSHDDGGKTRVLGVWAADSHRTPATLDRLANEYALREDLDASWAARPQTLLRERDAAVLLLEDPGGAPSPTCWGSRWTRRRSSTSPWR
ncbi:hypothetical protein [Cupriavidus sp. EM10]|uniref:hypothetical protein n=1 Tax=Cupriavidus sp. EM10 TaxID=2839983 RepID=UPI001CED4A87|nr:hypothetical protein [Cupriavidus sp. EM10]